MSMILCDAHGKAGFNPYVSKELTNNILNNVLLTASEIKHVDIKFFCEDTGEEIFDIRYWMSRWAFESLAAVDLYEVVSDEDEEKLDDLFSPIMNGGGVCVKCFNEYLERSRRGINL